MKDGLKRKWFIALHVLSGSHRVCYGDHNDFCERPRASGMQLDFADGRSQTAFSVFSGKEE
jgi:hypothetical protein